MGEHLIDGEFQSDKFPGCPRGKVPVSTKDPLAQDLLWTVAGRYDFVDHEFAMDLRQALINHGFVPQAMAMARMTESDYADLKEDVAGLLTLIWEKQVTGDIQEYNFELLQSLGKRVGLDPWGKSLAVIICDPETRIAVEVEESEAAVRCNVVTREANEHTDRRCVLARGHTGPHALARNVKPDLEDPRARLHCWADGPAADDGAGSTCMLTRGHAGPHAWTRDDTIFVKFGGDV